MAKLGQVKRLLKESLAGQGDLPGWIDTFIYIFNQAIDPIVSALTGRLTFADNHSGLYTTLSFTQGVSLEINPSVKGKVTGLVPMGAAAPYLISSFGYTIKQNGNVGVTLGFSTASSGVVTAVSAGTKVSATIFIQVG